MYNSLQELIVPCSYCEHMSNPDCPTCEGAGFVPVNGHAQDGQLERLERLQNLCRITVAGYLGLQKRIEELQSQVTDRLKETEEARRSERATADNPVAHLPPLWVLARPSQRPHRSRKPDGSEAMTTTETVRQKYLRQAHERVREEYAQHLIAEEGPGRWLLRKPRPSGRGDWDEPGRRWSGCMWTEIICLAHGGILVDGDIEPVVFRFGPDHPESRVHWMGQRKNAWDHYFREKATIGMGGRGFGSCLEKWDPEVAVCDVEEQIEYLIDDTSVSELMPRTVKTLDALRDDVLGELRFGECTQEEFCRELYRVLDDCENVGRYGVVPSWRMFTAHAALARLSTLLEEREAADGAG